MPAPANLVHELSTTTGTGNFTLSNVNGKQSFNTAFSTGGTDLFVYFISNRDAAEYEIGTGHLSASTTLVRDTIIEGTNGTSAVSFSAGTKDVTNAVLATTQANDGQWFNRVINPNGIVWQVQNTGAAAITDGTYCFDQWYGLTQSSAVTASQLTNIENGTPYGMRLSQANASAQRFGLAQVIETRDCIALRGKTITLSARVRMSASTTLRYAILEWTSTADAPTRDVVADWTSGTYTAGNFFLASNLTVTATGSTALTASTLATVSLKGTLGSSTNNLYVFFWSSSTQAQNVTLDVAKVQVEVGQVANAFFEEPYDVTVSRCQRFYEKSYDVDTAPGTGSGAGGLVISGYYADNSVVNGLLYPPQQKFQVQKRAAPSVTVYSYAGTAGFVGNSAGTDIGSSGVGTSANSGRAGFIAYNASGAGATTSGFIILYHWVADARL